MYNDFVLIGPSDDPAQVSAAKSVTEALKRIAQVQPTFVSRGDDSGTHRKELALWDAADRDPADFTQWYREVGAGMGGSLNSASAMNAYILADRASWLNFGNTGNLSLLFAGDPTLFNQYAYLPVNPKRHAHVKAKAARDLESWLVSSRAKQIINGYEIGGEALFVFNARP
jgi:tungstate transport system substrate-binding protein